MRHLALTVKTGKTVSTIIYMLSMWLSCLRPRISSTLGMTSNLAFGSASEKNAEKTNTNLTPSS